MCTEVLKVIKVLDLEVQLMKNRRINKSVAFLFLFSIVLDLAALEHATKLQWVWTARLSLI